jgi:hypothetical protein
LHTREDGRLAKQLGGFAISALMAPQESARVGNPRTRPISFAHQFSEQATLAVTGLAKQQDDARGRTVDRASQRRQ